MYKMRIANCRGRKPVITDICRCLRTLAVNEHEMNYCDARTVISEFRNKMAKILLADNPKLKIYK